MRPPNTIDRYGRTGVRDTSVREHQAVERVRYVCRCTCVHVYVCVKGDREGISGGESERSCKNSGGRPGGKKGVVVVRALSQRRYW